MAAVLPGDGGGYPPVTMMLPPSNNTQPGPGASRRWLRRWTGWREDHGRRAGRATALPGPAGGHRAGELGPPGVVGPDPDGPDLGGRHRHRQDRGAGGAGRDRPGHVLLDAPQPGTAGL